MDSPTFISLLKETHQKMLDISATKGQEYAGSEDRLANFKRLGAQLNLIPEKILWVYMTKHLDSLVTYIEDQQQGKGREYSEPITGRVDDAILYLNLLKALIVEREGITGDLGPSEKALSLNDVALESHCDGVGYLDCPSCVSPGDLGPLTTPTPEVMGVMEWQKTISAWADSVFPNRTVENSLAKLVLEEIPEFITSGMEDPLEYADLIIMILDIAHLQGIDVDEALRTKMSINRGRKWKINPKTGFMSHVKGTP